MNLKKVFIIAAFTAIIGLNTAFMAPVDPAAYDVLNLPELKVTATGYGHTLILSDSPEMVTADGIMYMDTVTESVRIFFHHVNDTKEDKRIVIVVENNASETANIIVSKYGIGGPGLDWIEVGKTAQLNYLNSRSFFTVEVAAKKQEALLSFLNKTVVKPNMLVNGIIDFITDKPVTVKIMMLPVKADIKKFSLEAAVLPVDKDKLRGTFHGGDRMIIPYGVYDPNTDGPAVITLADNNIDRYVEGIDATDGSKALNYGNYGVVYNLFLPSVEGKNIRYYLNPRGGRYAGGMGVKYKYAVNPAVSTPAERLFFGDDPRADFAAIGEFSGGQSLWLTFSPPGTANLPVKLIITAD